MAVSDRDNMLFVTNRDSGDLTVLDIQTRGVAASVQRGRIARRSAAFTPDNEYALVMDQRSSERIGSACHNDTQPPEPDQFAAVAAVYRVSDGC